MVDQRQRNRAKWKLKLLWSGPKGLQILLAKFGNQLAKTLPLIWPRKFTGTWCLPINLVTDQQIQELNARYRGPKRPTDVLTFSLQVKGVKFIEPPLKNKDLGEIYINHQQARRQAKELGQSYQQELRLLLIHGLLHLLGYDHRNTREQKLMTKMEQTLLLRTKET